MAQAYDHAVLSPQFEPYVHTSRIPLSRGRGPLKRAKDRSYRAVCLRSIPLNAIRWLWVSTGPVELVLTAPYMIWLNSPISLGIVPLPAAERNLFSRICSYAFMNTGQ